MAIQSGFFNSVNGDRRYDAKWFAQYFASFIANGVFPNPSTGLQVVEGNNMTTVVKVGKGWINGYFIVNDSDYVLQHDNADGVLKRIDRVVMRLNNLTRQIEIAIKKGSFASTPVAPPLQRDGDYYELALADVLINNGATQITQANITDTRLNKELCGIVHGVVNQVDTTTIFNQYQAWFNGITSGVEAEIDAWQVQEKTDFDAWFASIQNILDGDVAANLANQITNHINDQNVHIQPGEREKWDDTTVTSGALKTIKQNKDSKGVFTTVRTFRKNSGTLYQESILSGGTTPRYTTRTIRTYAPDGITLISMDTFTLTYDDKGILISEE